MRMPGSYFLDFYGSEGAIKLTFSNLSFNWRKNYFPRVDKRIYFHFGPLVIIIDVPTKRIMMIIIMLNLGTKWLIKTISLANK